MKDLFDSIGIYYNLIYKEKNYIDETKFIINILNQFSSNNHCVLEFGSGTGKHAAHLVKKGFKVDGIERSKALISCIENKKGFKCFKGDIRKIKLDEKYDVVISLFHVMSYMTTNKDLEDVFENAYFHLKPNGLFLFDFWYSPAVHYQKPQIRVKRLINSRYSILRIAEPNIFSEKNRVDVKYTVYVEDIEKKVIQKFEEIHPMRHFCIEELDSYARKSGFQLIDSGEWLTKNQPSEKSWGVYSCFKKI